MPRPKPRFAQAAAAANPTDSCNAGGARPSIATPIARSRFPHSWGLGHRLWPPASSISFHFPDHTEAVHTTS
jgi:hypothetical protein